MRASARSLVEMTSDPGAPVPRSLTQLAALAIELHHEFLTRDPLTGEEHAVRPSTEGIGAALAHLTAQR